MTADPGVLFELAARDMEMRPEFRANLAELLQRTAVAPPSSGGHVRSPDLIEPVGDDVTHPRRWSRKLLLVAAAFAGVLGLAVFQLNRSGSRQPANRPGAECESADQLGVVDLTPTDLLIGLSGDGETFCLSMNVSPTAGADMIAVGAGLAQSSPTAPTLMQSAAGPSGSGTYYYLFAIPETVPVSEVRGDGAPTLFFTSQVGRRLLIVETVDPRFAAQTVVHTWTMLSVNGASLGTLTAQGPPSQSQTGRAGNGGQ